MKGRHPPGGTPGARHLSLLGPEGNLHLVQGPQGHISRPQSPFVVPSLYLPFAPLPHSVITYQPFNLGQVTNASEPQFTHL